MRDPMIPTGKFIDRAQFLVVAETPQIARGYSGSFSAESLVSTRKTGSETERKERGALRHSEVLNRRDNLTLKRKP